MRHWLPRKGMKVSLDGHGWSFCTLLRRLSSYGPENELWEAYNPVLGRRVTVAVGTFYAPWEGRR